MSDDVQTVLIERLGTAGDGVAAGPDGPIYIPFALPGETWRVPAEALASAGPELRVAAPERHAPRCGHYQRCGGCQAQHMPDPLYADWKRRLLVGAFRHHGIAFDPEPLVRVPLQSRRRAVLAAELRGGDVRVGFHRANTHEIEPITDCTILTPRIVSALRPLGELVTAVVKPLQIKSRSLRLTVLDTLGGLAVDIDGLEDAATGIGPAARARLAEIAAAASLAQISLGGDVLIRRAAPVIHFSGIAVEPPPGAFVQAVADAERWLVDLVTEAVGPAKRVADLFAGLGTFSLALALRAKVLAADSEAPLLRALTLAARKAEGLKPIETLTRDLMREPLSPKELEPFDAIVFDPPRAGAAAQVERIARARCPTVVAVSCNPATLARDVRVLVDAGFRLERLVPVDQFVFTPHLEVVAVLRRPQVPKGRRP